MKHAVILAHPKTHSLNARIARAYIARAREVGEAVIERDLYAMGFDPCLKAEEIPGAELPHFAADIVQERLRLRDVDVFVFIYPLWFNAPPAILKGYVDRVFGMGFGFAPSLAGTQPRLAGRKLISFTTSGAPEAWVRETGALDALTHNLDDHLSAMCGMSILDHVHFGGIVPDMAPAAVAAIVDRVRETVEQRFAPAAADV